MKYSYVVTLLFLSFFPATSSAQTRAYAGLSLGSETGIGAPSLSVDFEPFDNSNLYMGLNGSIWVIGLIWYSVGTHAGYRQGPLSFEMSLGHWRLPEQVPGIEQVGPMKRFTLTPKLGLEAGIIQLKIGHSMILSESYFDGPHGATEFLRIGKIRPTIGIYFDLQSE